jgi:CBS domain-containing protein
MLTDRDIVLRVVAEGRDARTITCAEIASRQLATIDPQQPLEEALRLMGEHQVRRLPVVEEDGKLVGVLAQADVARTDPAETGALVKEISS